jgi:hypothetical protein
MEKFARLITRPEHVLSYSLGFVAAWFGLNEILSPQDWVTFAPAFLGNGIVVVGLVIVHGIILATCALLLILNVGRRTAAIILTLVFVEVVIELLTQTGLTAIAVRDIGLGGMAVGLALLISSQKGITPVK